MSGELIGSLLAGRITLRHSFGYLVFALDGVVFHGSVRTLMTIGR